MTRLARLAAARGGTIAGADVERDELLARDRGTTSAAARMLAGGTDVMSTPETDPRPPAADPVHVEGGVVEVDYGEVWQKR